MNQPTQYQRTSITIPPTLWMEVQKLAKQQERSFSQTLCMLARQGMKQTTVPQPTH